MGLLLDTHVFIWIVFDDRRLRRRARKIVEGADAVFVSAASIWEAAIKTSLGKLDLSPDLLASHVSTSGFTELPVSARHAVQLASLPLLHRDPFDLLLIAQATYEGLRLMSVDAELRQYGDIVVSV